MILWNDSLLGRAPTLAAEAVSHSFIQGTGVICISQTVRVSVACIFGVMLERFLVLICVHGS